MRWDYGTIYKKIRKSKHISQEEVCAVVLLNLYDYRLKMIHFYTNSRKGLSPVQYRTKSFG